MSSGNMIACETCNGSGWYKYDHNHAKKCEFCCPHDQGWHLLEEHYGADNGKLCCVAGCGTVKPNHFTSIPNT